MSTSNITPTDEELKKEVESILLKNKGFGVKKVLNSIKEANPSWTIGEKRGTEL